MAEEKNQVTLEDYYLEISPKKRGKILESLMELDDGRDNQIRKELYNLRYSSQNLRRDGELADGYIALWMNIKLTVDNSTGFFGNRGMKKELTKTLAKLGITKYMQMGNLEKKILYDEFYHMAVLYIQSSLTDKNYTTAFMGMISMKDDQIRSKLAGDVYKVAYLMPRRVSMEEEFSIFTKAATEAFCDILPDYREQLEELIKELK